MIDFSEGLLWYVAFLFSTTFHEASHAWASMKMGDLTAYEGGQVSLSPLPHIKKEPIGTVVVPLISFLIGGWMIGWAKTPYDPEWAYEHPKKSAAMAAAGPMSNFILILISALLIHTGILLGVFYAPETIHNLTVVASVNPGVFENIAAVLSVMFSLNVLLFLFNLIPVPPLDGSGIIPMFLSDNSGRKYMSIINTAGIAFIGIFIAWKLFDLFEHRLQGVFLNLLYPGSNYQ